MVVKVFNTVVRIQLFYAVAWGKCCFNYVPFKETIQCALFYITWLENEGVVPVYHTFVEGFLLILNTILEFFCSVCFVNYFKIP